MTDPELDPLLRELSRTYHEPPAPPAEAMWQRIEAARRAPAKVTPLRWKQRWTFPVGIAAVLAIGFALGRVSGPATPPARGGAAVEVARVSPAEIAATDHLSRVEVFLTGFKSEPLTPAADSQFATQARQLLATTRILLDSRAVENPRLEYLLQELELVLAQISYLPAEKDAGLDIVVQDLDRRGTLARLRSAVPSGRVPVATQGEL